MSVDNVQLRVTPEQLKASKNKMEAYVNQYLSWNRSFYNEVEQMKGKWSGEANQKFTARFNEFKNELSKLEALLREYATFLGTSATKYDNTETAAANRANSLPTKL